MGKGNKAPKAPSYKNQIKNADKISEASMEGMSRSRNISDEQLGHFRTQAIQDRANTDKANEGLYKTAGLNEDFAASLQDRYKNVYQPLEDDLINEYKDYASEGRYDLNRGRAMANVGDQYEAARRNSMRELESYGINPAATRFAALDLGVRTQEAAAKAAAANQADVMTENTARALRSEAMKYGSQIPGWADTASDTAINANNSAVANTLNTTKTDAATTGTGTDWGQVGIGYAGAATGANNSAINAQKSQYEGQLAQYNADQASSSGWGDALGLAAGIGAKAFLGPTMPWVFAAAKGGAIPAPGAVPDEASPSGGQAVDDVNAKLTAGEFVLPEDVTRWIGEKKLQDMILKAREEKRGAKAKPTKGQAIPGPVTYVSRPEGGAIPMRG